MALSFFNSYYKYFKIMDNKSKYSQIKQVIIKKANLPFFCTGTGTSPQFAAFDMHPKIYLPIEKQKMLSCPYCGTKYIFVEEKKFYD